MCIISFDSCNALEIQAGQTGIILILEVRKYTCGDDMFGLRPYRQ